MAQIIDAKVLCGLNITNNLPFCLVIMIHFKYGSFDII